MGLEVGIYNLIQRLKPVDLHSVKPSLAYRCHGGSEDGSHTVFSVKKKQ